MGSRDFIRMVKSNDLNGVKKVLKNANYEYKKKVKAYQEEYSLDGKHLIVDHQNDENNKLLVYCYDEMGFTPLHWAIRRNFVEMAQFLIENDAYVNQQDSFHRSPLLLAVELQRVSLVQILLTNNANPAVQNMAHHSSLCLCSETIEHQTEQIMKLNQQIRHVFGDLIELQGTGLTLNPEFKELQQQLEILEEK